MSAPPSSRQSLIITLSTLMRRYNVSRKLSLLLVLATLVSGIATFVIMTSAGPDGSNPSLVLNLLYVDAVLLLLLGSLILRRLLALRTQNSKGVTGSKLQSRLVLFFSVLAVTPAILMAIFAGIYLNLGMQAWFNERVSTALKSTQTIAQAYQNEHVRSIQIDALAIANYFNRNASYLSRSRNLMERDLNRMALDHNLAEAAIIDGRGQVLAQTALTLSLSFDALSDSIIEKANQNEVVLTFERQNDRARAVVKLDRYIDTYLFIGRFIPPEVSGSLDRVERAYKQYAELEKQREGIHISFVMIFMIIALMLLLASAWFGMMLANRMVRPLSELIEASERIRAGDLTTQVVPSASSDEIGTLGRAFNRMVEQLNAQHGRLMDANRELAERHRFTETVLDGVSAGVIGLDRNGIIHLPNRFALLFFDRSFDTLKGIPLIEAIPELSSLFAQVSQKPHRKAQDQIKILRGSQLRVIIANIVGEWINNELIGYVLTFDDITELQSAQRRAAWANVARRIAHEIKNPLTPIQLSAERLKRKYLKTIEQDPHVFELCTDTIIRQVDDMRQMVDEFSSFARMPRPELKTIDVAQLCEENVFLEKNRGLAIDYSVSNPDGVTTLLCDRQQISRVLTNLLKNAGEAIYAKHNLDPDGPEPIQNDTPLGHITLNLEHDSQAQETRIRITDTGKGFPQDEREKLTDPYVTTREKGTGLGLAIVKKIMEEHQGHLDLSDNPEGGGVVILTFPELDESGSSLSHSTPLNPMDAATRLITDGA